MKGRLFRSKKFYLSIIVLLATSGTIFFFPMNIDGQYTCYYHRIFNHSHPVSEVNMLDHRQTGYKNFSKSDDYKMSNRTSEQSDTEVLHNGSALLDKYLHQYALAWWASVGILALCIYWHRKLKQKVTANKSSITVKQ